MDIEHRELSELIASLNLASYTIHKEYLADLSKFYEVVPLIDIHHEKAHTDTNTAVNLLKLSKVCYEKGEDILQKLSTIYNAALSDNVQMIILIDSLNNKPVDFYIGFSSLTATLGQNINLLKSGIDGNFTGTKLDNIDKTGDLFDDIMGSVNTITSVSTSSSLRDKTKTENKDFIQGIEKFIDAMQGKIYTAIFIAGPIDKNTSIEMKDGLESLYTTLSQFQKTVTSFNENESNAVMESISDGVSTSIAKSTGTMESTTGTITSGSSQSSTTTKTVGSSQSTTNTSTSGTMSSSSNTNTSGTMSSSSNTNTRGTMSSNSNTDTRGTMSSSSNTDISGTMSSNSNTDTRGTMSSSSNTQTKGSFNSESKGSSYGGNIGINGSKSSGSSNSNTANDIKSELIRGGLAFAGSVIGTIVSGGVGGGGVGKMIGGVTGKIVAPGLNNAVSQSISSALGGGIGGNMSKNSNKTTGTNNSTSVGTTTGTNNSTSTGTTTGTNNSTSTGTTTGTNNSTSVGMTTGTNNSTSVGTTTGTNNSTSTGTTTGTNKSASTGTTTGTNKSVSTATTTGTNNSTSTATTQGTSTQETNTDGTTNTNTSGTTDTLSKGKTTQFESENKSVTSILKHIDSQLEKIENGRAYGLFKFGAYFMSSREDNAILAANIYKSLMIGDEVEVENRAVNVWRETEKLKHIKDYLKKGLNPMFSLEEVHNLYYDATTIVNGKDLPIHMGIPVKSVIGIPVVEHTRFGRSVPSIENDKLKLGSIFHMGKIENSYEVNLDIKNLTSHTFITGTTGSGKSNTIYKMLDELSKMGKKFLIIEPAKGEYKNVFGHREDVEVYGTNNKKTKLLRINPFKFNDDIHVLEHIDRLIDIFNVCWAMYAAMPAILKDAVERAYVVAGWDLELSENIHSENLYPTFEDVLDEIENVLNESQYSSDNKGDYIGALSTRIRSLTTGINGMIFTQNDLSDDDLFNKNVIVDLSRVGSSETKSLIMGLLIMKLSEYHMANGEDNAPLKHVTVLEEAHNILKRTSTEQVSESSNLIGKSVEMLSNAIAEMRTYGEGFIIADQSPNMLDMSAIRNTNTKIIMKLPDISDRELVGKSANLNDDQIIELSRLETGVCAVYQNNWLEPVLCQVDEFKVPKDENGSVKKYVNSDDISKKLDMKTYIINMVKAKQIKEGMDIPEGFMQSNLKSSIKRTFLEVQNGTADKSELIYKLFYDKKTFNNISQKLDAETCLKNISQLTVPSIANYDVDIQKEIVQQLLIEQSKQNSNYLEILDRIKSIM